MSLLLDALKQAEAQRKQAQEGTEADNGLALEPLPSTTQSPPAAAAAQNVTRPAARPNAAPVRRPDAPTSARTVFQVKQQATLSPSLLIGVLALLLFAAGATYVWWETRPRGMQTGPALSGAMSYGTQTLSQAPAPSVTPAAADVRAQPTDTTTSRVEPPTPTTTDKPTPSGTSSRPTLQARSTAGLVARPVQPASGVDAAITEPAGSGVESAAGPALSVRRGANAAPSISPAQRGFEAYQTGDFAQARQQYLDALRQEPRNIDVLNALGMLALREGQTDTAERYFRQSLVVDPKDALAASQLALLYAEGDAVAAESRLRTLIAGQAESAPLHFALGSVFARQGRWREAQQMFFQAHTLDTDNPDILFNLAVSLDRLQQVGLARQFYERALGASTRKAAGFDRSAVQRRLQTLNPAPAPAAP